MGVEKRSTNRVYCGLRVQFDQDDGHASDIADASVFIALSSPATAIVGQEGTLSVHDRGEIFREPGVVVRVTARGIAVISLAPESVLLRFREALFGDVLSVEQTSTEVRASLWGYISADIATEWQKISQGSPQPFRYILDFQRVTDVAPSGLALLLQLSTSPRGRNDVQIIHCSEKVEAILSSIALPGTGITIAARPDAVSNAARRFSVAVESNEFSEERVTIFMPEVFDYEARLEFARIYQGRSRKVEYVLDFSATKHLAKSAFGTLLLMHQHVGLESIANIKIVGCSAKIRKMFQDMAFQKFFHIVEAS